MEIKLKGWSAVAALVVIGAVLGGKLLMERSTLETEAMEQLKLTLQGEYGSYLLHDVDADRLTNEEMEAKAAELLELQDIRFTSIKARGRGDDVRVRVEVEVAGGDPPDGERVRYYKLSHSTLTGWRVRREITALSYYLKLF
ncbi:MAG: hypothetical protein GWN99_20260 [Gemmatimonadetes bacterium]|uniref:Uncharacterized protein n=1 Tax=Candidatus Kutchimonas denitrificans TaxID=3056748 RepID=A0AAE4ZAD1_9BACT|nr:hypothetical protein [Gemmatimonadota bacterium]NIR76538.1 hypothetical protein [Candidatus Kutchimonas denitrificans]NIS03356.1 hypothetical protein [Gemmatimonadota bacterium]NIT69217.1 hypothetical protein [Gemmatimonadota bacterium]NIU54609.1 hypothetical protein [Gemmatimonadota bacterium]